MIMTCKYLIIIKYVIIIPLTHTNKHRTLFRYKITNDNYYLNEQRI